SEATTRSARSSRAGAAGRSRAAASFPSTDEGLLVIAVEGQHRSSSADRDEDPGADQQAAEDAGERHIADPPGAIRQPIAGLPADRQEEDDHHGRRTDHERGLAAADGEAAANGAEQEDEEEREDR